MDGEKRQGAYGKSRLVLMAVDPYSIYAYWEVMRQDLEEAEKAAGKTTPVIRFYKLRKTSLEDTTAEWFDVEVDIRSRSCYVRLWSSEPAYEADLALRRIDGTIVRLARASILDMPRAVPTIGVKQHFMKVDEATATAEIVPSPVPSSKFSHRTSARPANQPDVASSGGKPGDFTESVRKKLGTLYASRHWRSRGKSAEYKAMHSDDLPLSGVSPPDLTAMAENNLVTGLSSVSLEKDQEQGGSGTEK